MLNSLNVGISGMDAFQKALETVSNNITNLNTPGFKSSSFEFEAVSSGNGSDTGQGGAQGAAPEGQGVRFVQPYVNFTQGDIKASTNPLDLGVRGSGFLVVKDGDSVEYLRTGQFTVADDGKIVDRVSGKQLMLLNAGVLQPASVDGMRLSAPQATSSVTFSDNLSSTASSHTVKDVTVYDDAGTGHTLTLQFSRASASTPGQWNVLVSDASGKQVGSGSLTYAGNAPLPGQDSISVELVSSSGKSFDTKLDFSGTTGFDSGQTSTLKLKAADGFGTGTLTTEAVDSTGAIVLTYSNGKTATLGSIALADFSNPESLRAKSDGLYVTAHGQQPRLVVSGDARAGTVSGASLEASNVDLSGEFGNLILVQRGYQASSQVISTANDMIQQLFELRGQR
jgi:flagellar hook protein FlgE